VPFERRNRDLSGHSPDKLWADVEKTLPSGTDGKIVRAVLERIAADRLSLKKLAREHSKRAEEFEKNGDTISARHEREQALLQRRRLRGTGPLSTSIRFRQQFQILQLWQRISGTEPGYRTQRQVRPSGKTIRFFCAAYAFVFKKILSASHAKDIIQEFRRRNIRPPQLTPTVAMRIDETKISVVPAKSDGIT
jgi:hypothetical protein